MKNKEEIKKVLYNPELLTDTRLIERNIDEGLITEDEALELIKNSEDYSKNVIILNIPMENKQDELLARKSPLISTEESDKPGTS